MKKNWTLWLGTAAATFAMLLASAGRLAGQEASSLGDYAKSVRATPHRRAAVNHRFDNDNLPRDTTISVMGEKPAPVAAPDETTEAITSSKAPEAAPQDDLATRRATQNEWQKKIAEQKQSMDLLARELDVLQRELKMRTAQFYGNAASQLQNSAQWYKQNAESQQNIADKQAALALAGKKLEDMQEQARKAGVPAGMRE